MPLIKGIKKDSRGMFRGGRKERGSEREGTRRKGQGGGDRPSPLKGWCFLSSKSQSRVHLDRHVVFS